MLNDYEKTFVCCVSIMNDSFVQQINCGRKPKHWQKKSIDYRKKTVNYAKKMVNSKKRLKNSPKQTSATRLPCLIMETSNIPMRKTRKLKADRLGMPIPTEKQQRIDRRTQDNDGMPVSVGHAVTRFPGYTQHGRNSYWILSLITPLSNSL